LLYPLSFAYDTFYKFADSFGGAKLPVFGPKKLTYLVKLPFIGYQSSKKLIIAFRNLNRNINPHISIRFIFVNNYNISSLFPFKDKFPINMMSHVVYELGCETCSGAYIGLTNRLLPSRVKEHKEHKSYLFKRRRAC
jgi:hypothetical protein